MLMLPPIVLKRRWIWEEVLRTWELVSGFCVFFLLPTWTLYIWGLLPNCAKVVYEVCYPISLLLSPMVITIEVCKKKYFSWLMFMVRFQFQHCFFIFLVLFHQRFFCTMWGNFCPSTSGSTRWLCLKTQMLPMKDKCERVSRC